MNKFNCFFNSFPFTSGSDPSNRFNFSFGKIFISPSELKNIIDPRRISEMYSGKRKTYQGYTVEFIDNSKPSLIYLE